MSEKKSKFKKTDATISINPMQDDLKKMAGLGAAATGLSAAGKRALKDLVKSDLRYAKELTKKGKQGDFGTPQMSNRAAKELKAGSMQSRAETGFATRKHSVKALEEARKFLKKKKIKYRKQKEVSRKARMNKGGLIKGFPKLAKKGF